jgi:hypothetical protein
MRKIVEAPTPFAAKMRQLDMVLKNARNAQRRETYAANRTEAAATAEEVAQNARRKACAEKWVYGPLTLEAAILALPPKSRVEKARKWLAPLSPTQRVAAFLRLTHPLAQRVVASLNGE